MEKSTP